MQPDPIGLAGGINPYVYVGNDPLDYIDPTGTNPLLGAVEGAEIGSLLGPAGTVAGGVIGAGMAIYLGDQLANWAMGGATGVYADRPPPGSLPISDTPWSGDHGSIKRQVGAAPTDDVRIDPDGNVWVQNPDGSWTNYGPASSYTGSGKPNGRRGKDRGCR